MFNCRDVIRRNYDDRTKCSSIVGYEIYFMKGVNNGIQKTSGK